MDKPLTKNIRRDHSPPSIKEYEKSGGYQGLHKALKMTPQEVTTTVKNANLRGMGGAGFPTGLKWASVPMDDNAPLPKYIVVNADEMEPGTFKDRFLMEGDPHLLIEGAIIAAYAVQASVAYIFLRAEYPRSADNLNRAIAEAAATGYLGRDILGTGYNLEVYVHTSAGRYICGESSALLNALEGRRAIPRAKGVRATTSGLWGKPTVVNNVETLCNVPGIIAHGVPWYKGLSKTSAGGTKLYGVSGKVNRPGLWELPMGTSIREILEEHAGGMREGLGIRGVLPGGASTKFVLEKDFDVAMDFDSVGAVGSRMGTGTMIVLDDQTCPVGMLSNMQHFFAQESCGWCTPCRDGLPWVASILDAIEHGYGERNDLGILSMHVRWLNNTFCKLAPGAMEPLGSALEYFQDDFERHIDNHRCPWR